MRELPGLEDPFARACEALRATTKQLVLVATILAGSLAATDEKVAWGRAAAFASATVLLGLAAAAAIRAQTRRDRALDLILEGRDGLPITVVQRQRRRLSGPRTRRTLARTLESMVAETVDRRPLALRSARRSLYRPLIAAVRDDIIDVAELLRSNHATVRGVAFSERLITNNGSPLYGRDVAALRRELLRVRTLLEAG